MPDKNDYYITYGFGYAKYLHTSNNIIQNLTVFVPREDSIKVNILNLKNTLPRKRNLKIVYYIKKENVKKEYLVYFYHQIWYYTYLGVKMILSIMI